MSESEAIGFYNEACDLIECNGRCSLIIDRLNTAIRIIEESSSQHTIPEVYARSNILMGQMIEWSDSHSALQFYGKAASACNEIGEAYLQLARCIWKSASSESELHKVEELLRLAISKSRGDDDAMELAKKFLGRFLLTTSTTGSSRYFEACDILIELGYEYTFSSPVLSYSFVNRSTGSNYRMSARVQNDFVIACDNVLPPCMLVYMKRIFNTSSPFWSDHGYDSPSTGFFSYQIHLPLYGPPTAAPASSSFEQVIEHIWRATCSQMPRVRTARYAEWWAHSRPHSNGHLLHYDYVAPSEPGAPPEHPLATSILFVTADCGGPTLVTNETIRHPVTERGWIIQPAENRMASFRGSQLHCVLPGAGVCSNREARRITLMVAFYEEDPRAPAFPVAIMNSTSRPRKKLKTKSKIGHTWPVLFAEPISPLLCCKERRKLCEPIVKPVAPRARVREKINEEFECSYTSSGNSCICWLQDWVFEKCSIESGAVIPVSEVYSRLIPSSIRKHKYDECVNKRGRTSTISRKGGGISLLDDRMFAQFDALNSGLLLSENGVCSLNCGGTCEICRAKHEFK